VTLNIYRGGGNVLRFQSILDTLQAMRPDVVVLQECLGWEDGQRLQRSADFLGLPHTFLGQGRPRSSWLQYHVAVLSRWPLELPVFYADPQIQAHCLVHVQVQGIHLLATHLDAHSEDTRLGEVRWLNQLGLQHQEAVLAADLNSLSLHDPYPRNLSDQLTYLGMTRFGRGGRFDVCRELATAGWLDALYAPLAPGQRPEQWVTARRQGIGFRSDYIMISPSLRPRLRECRVEVISEAVSDHFPVLCELCLT